MVQLYTANHLITTGITDLEKVIVDAAKLHNLDIENDNSITSKVIVFIDEFSSKYELEYLLRVKKEKQLKYILVSTEFETNGSLGPSFNEFSSGNKYIAKMIFGASLLLYWTPKSIRSGKILGKLSACLGLLFLLPSVLILKTLRWTTIVDNFRTFKRSIYMKARRRGYDEFKSNADLVVKIHHRLYDSSNDNVLYPVLPKAAQLQHKNIKVSGTQTAYRIKMCNVFLKNLQNTGHQSQFQYDGSIKFDIKSTNRLYGFAYQPAQSDSWDKSNPIKIWRDYFLHGALPIVDKKFGDHPIEMVATTTDQFLSAQVDRLSVNTNHSKYHQLVHTNNEKIFNKIAFLVKSI